MFQTFLSATKDDLKKASISLKQSTPVAMNTMLAKQPKEEAIKKREERKKNGCQGCRPNNTR